jgi:hypothetical protein
MKTKPITFLLALTFLFLFSGSSVVLASLNDCIRSYETKERFQAPRLCSPFAEKGDAIAQYLYGRMFWDKSWEGIVTHSYDIAYKYLKLSAGQGHADAQNLLGTMYKKGQGVAIDYKEAVKWYQLAANQGLEEAKKSLQHLERRINRTQNKKQQRLTAQIQKVGKNREERMVIGKADPIQRDKVDMGVWGAEENQTSTSEGNKVDMGVWGAEENQTSTSEGNKVDMEDLGTEASWWEILVELATAFKGAFYMVWTFAPVIVWLSLFVVFKGRMRVFLIFVTLIGLYFVEILSDAVFFPSIIALVGMWIFAEFVGGLSQVLGLEPNDAERKMHEMEKERYEMEKERHERWKQENDR